MSADTKHLLLTLLIAAAISFGLISYFEHRKVVKLRAEVAEVQRRELAWEYAAQLSSVKLKTCEDLLWSHVRELKNCK